MKEHGPWVPKPASKHSSTTHSQISVGMHNLAYDHIN